MRLVCRSYWKCFLNLKTDQLAAAKFSQDRFRVSAAIEDGMDLHKFLRNRVVDRERKLVRDAAMISEDAPMNPSGGAERINVHEERVTKVATETLFLLLIEVKAGN